VKMFMRTDYRRGINFACGRLQLEYLWIIFSFISSAAEVELNSLVAKI
jgi:hypothetical protein